MENNNVEILPLDDAAIATIAGLREQQRIAHAAAQTAILAVVQYFTRQHELPHRDVQITLADNDREIIIRKVDQYGRNAASVSALAEDQRNSLPR